MNKNVKRMFFVLTLVMLLATIGAVCAADDANSTHPDDSSVSDAAKVSDTASDTVAAKPIQTTCKDNKVDTKTIEKEDKNIKKDIIRKEFEINNKTEFVDAITQMTNDTNNDEYILNINKEINLDYNYKVILNNTSNVKTLTINGNNNRINPSGYSPFITITNNYTLNLNDMTMMTQSVSVNNNGTLNVNNALFRQLNLYGTSTLNNISAYINNYANDTVIQNSVINNSLYVYEGRVILRNDTLNYTINNYAELILEDDCILDSRTVFIENLPITNRTDLIYYVQSIANTSISNLNLTKDIGPEQLSLNGNTTLINCYIDKRLSVNQGNHYLINCTINSSINNGGNLTVSDDCIFGENFRYDEMNGRLYINDTNKIYPYTMFFKTDSLLHDMTINKQIQTYANMTLRNCTLNSSIVNQGTLIIEDDCIFAEKFSLSNSGSGSYIINDTESIIPYLATYIGNYTLENLTFITYKGVGVNSTLKLVNCVLNASLNTNGILIIDNDCIIGTNFKLTGTGITIMNNSNRIYPYVTTFNGSHELNNLTINKTITNYGNLTLKNITLNTTITNYGNISLSDDSVIENNTRIIGNGFIITNNTDKVIPYLRDINGDYLIENSELNAIINISPRTGMQTVLVRINYGKLTFINSTINTPIYNIGTLIISDDTQFGEYFNYTGTGELIINDTSRIIPYLQSLNGNYTLNDTVLNKNLINLQNLTLNNVTINSTINNSGILVINDDCSFTDNFILINTGTIITNNTNQVFSHLNEYKSDYAFENITWTNNKTNNGNLNLTNCNISNMRINNRQNMTFINCIIENTILSNLGNVLMINCSYINCYGLYNGEHQSSPNYGQVIYGYGVFEIINTTIANNTLLDITTSNNGKLFSFRNSTLNNITFENNSGGINLYYTNVTDSSFINNQQIVTDNLRIDGGVLYVSGNTTIDNCKFINNTFKLTNSLNNGGHGGALGVSDNTTITNTLFDTNILDSTSTWANSGSGGAIGASYISQVYSLTVLNCTFKNNTADNHAAGSSSTGEYQNAAEGASIYIGSISRGDILIENNTFTDEYSRSYGSILVNQNPYGGNQNATTTIRNNNFTNIKSDYETLKINGTGTKTVENNNYQNCTIQYKNLTLTAPEKIYSNDIITITANIELLNSDYYDEDLLDKTSYIWYIDGENTTNSNTSVNINTTNENHILYITPTISTNRSPILLITPTLVNDIVITPENINRYVFDGELLVSPNTKLLFNGEFNNIGEIYNTKNEVIFNGENATFTNTTFIIEAHNNTIHNMNINNTDTSAYIITLIGNDNRVNNNTLTQYNSNGQTAAIYNNNGENNIISNNTINVTGPSLSITYSGGTSTANTQAILSVGGQNNQIIYNNITVSNSTDAELEQFSTIEAITAPQGINNNIIYNNIYCTGARFNYGINTLDNVINNKITYNNITVTGYRYTDGIQVGNAATGNIIANNNINITCLNTTPVDEAAISYGVIITSQGGQTSDNNTITENTININGAVNYGMEIYTATNTKITENNITLNGVKSMGIGYAHSPNSLVANNTLIITDDSSQPLNSVTEEIQPLSVGIRIQQDSENIQIENNTITTNDKAKTDKTIDTTDANTTIKNNKLTSSTGYGDETTKTISATTLENNTIETTTTLKLPETIITNTPVTLTATVTTTDGTPINGGLITFTKGNEVLAQATVTDGIATAIVTFTQEEDSTITATYTPESTGLSTSSAEATTSIQNPVTQLNIEDVELTAGETVTLTATVTDQARNNINGGKVVFKVNGKTIKDEHGKVVYAKVVDGVATVEYTVPDNMNGKDLNITATYSGSGKYNKATTSITTTVEETTPTFTTESVTGSAGSTVQLKATITDGDKVINTGKVVFKINGKTVKDENGKVIYAKVVNNQVIVNYTLPADMKAKDYNITATFISSDYERLEDTKTLTVN